MGLSKGKGQTLVTDSSAALLTFAESATSAQEANTSKRLEKSRDAAQKRHKTPKEVSKLKDGPEAQVKGKQQKMSALDKAKLQVKQQGQRKRKPKDGNSNNKSGQNAETADQSEVKPKKQRKVAFA